MPGLAPLTGPRLGWLGKLPSRGDFLSGGAPSALLEGWRAWAETGMAGVRGGGPAARDAFLTAPLWRFACRAGVFGPGGGFGVASPGIDSAGRLFPMVVAAEAEIGDPAAALAELVDWAERAERALLSALDPRTDPGALGTTLPAPPRPSSEPRAGPAIRFEARAPLPRREVSDEVDDALFARLYGPKPEPEPTS